LLTPFASAAPPTSAVRPQNYLSLLDSWEFNTFCFSDLTKGRPLTVVVVAAMTHFDLFEHFNLSEAEVTSCVGQLEALYKARNPYHSNVHAADVTQSMCAVLVSSPALCLRRHPTQWLPCFHQLHQPLKRFYTPYYGSAAFVRV
jgi:hypothetical protein